MWWGGNGRGRWTYGHGDADEDDGEVHGLLDGAGGFFPRREIAPADGARVICYGYGAAGWLGGRRRAGGCEGWAGGGEGGAGEGLAGEGRRALGEGAQELDGFGGLVYGGHCVEYCRMRSERVALRRGFAAWPIEAVERR